MPSLKRKRLQPEIHPDIHIEPSLIRKRLQLGPHTEPTLKNYHVAHRSSRLRYFHCTKRLARYRLAQLAVEGYVKSVKVNLLANNEVKSKLKEEFKSRRGGVASPHLTRNDLEMTVGRLAAQRLVTKALQVRKRNSGLLIESLKHVKSIQLKDVGTQGTLSPTFI